MVTSHVARTRMSPSLPFASPSFVELLLTSSRFNVILVMVDQFGK